MRPVAEPTTGASGVSAVVRRLASFDEPAGMLLRELLEAQCRLSGADAAAAVRPSPTPDPDRPEVEVLAVHPATGQVGMSPPWLQQAIRLIPSSADALEEVEVFPLRAPGSLYGQGAGQHAVLCPVRGEAGVESVAVFLVVSADRSAAEACRERLELSQGLFALYQTQVSARKQRRGAKLLSVAVGVLTAVGEQHKFRAAAMALCNEVATRWKASRVSLGVQRGRYVKLLAMSRTEHVDRKTKLVQAIESAMEECLDQDVEVSWPEAGEAPCVARAARELSDGAVSGGGRPAVVSIPLRRATAKRYAEPEAVLTVELPGGEPPSKEAAEALRLMGNLVAPLLLKLYESDRALPVKAAVGTRKLAAAAVGPEHTWAKLTAVAILAAVLFLVFAEGRHLADAPFLIQAKERQLVAAPFDGYLKSVHVEPGDPVAADETVLAALETAELRLELSSLLAERMKYEKEAEVARRENKTAEAQIARAEARKVAAEVRLLEHRIERARLTSPMSGLVLEGDHTRKIGGAVSEGETLFEVAPLEGLRAELRVPEDRVAELQVGQRGELAAASRPGRYLRFVVEKIEPKAQVIDGRNVFRVWVRLERVPRWLRPGMEGVAKVKVGEARYAWLWTHEAVEWVRMKLWL